MAHREATLVNARLREDVPPGEITLANACLRKHAPRGEARGDMRIGLSGKATRSQRSSVREGDLLGGLGRHAHSSGCNKPRPVGPPVVRLRPPGWPDQSPLQTDTPASLRPRFGTVRIYGERVKGRPLSHKSMEMCEGGTVW